MALELDFDAAFQRFQLGSGNEEDSSRFCNPSIKSFPRMLTKETGISRRPGGLGSIQMKAPSQWNSRH
jgi:hypothetical protein